MELSATITITANAMYCGSVEEEMKWSTLEAGVTYNDSRSISRENLTTSSGKLIKRSKNSQYYLYFSFLIASESAGIAS